MSPNNNHSNFSSTATTFVPNLYWVRTDSTRLWIREPQTVTYPGAPDWPSRLTDRIGRPGTWDKPNRANPLPLR